MIHSDSGNVFHLGASNNVSFRMLGPWGSQWRCLVANNCRPKALRGTDKLDLCSNLTLIKGLPSLEELIKHKVINLSEDYLL